MSKAYGERLLDPRWQKLRLQVLNRCKWKCMDCSDEKSTLHVHHAYYVKGRDPWDYPPMSLTALCKSCHEDRHDRHGGGPEYWMPFEQVFEVAEKVEFDGANAECHAADAMHAVLWRTDQIESITAWALMNGAVIFGRAVEAASRGVDANDLVEAFDELLREKFGFLENRAHDKYQQWKAERAKAENA
jgi:hypothetical protein